MSHLLWSLLDVALTHWMHLFLVPLSVSVAIGLLYGVYTLEKWGPNKVRGIIIWEFAPPLVERILRAYCFLRGW